MNREFHDLCVAMDGPSTDDAIEKLGDLLNITSKVSSTVQITISSVRPKRFKFHPKFPTVPLVCQAD